MEFLPPVTPLSDLDANKRAAGDETDDDTIGAALEPFRTVSMDSGGGDDGRDGSKEGMASF